MREAEKRTEGRREVRVTQGPYEKGGELQESFQPNGAKDAKPGKRDLSWALKQVVVHAVTPEAELHRLEDMEPLQ